jgi:hypothetical protein
LVPDTRTRRGSASSRQIVSEVGAFIYVSIARGGCRLLFLSPLDGERSHPHLFSYRRAGAVRAVFVVEILESKVGADSMPFYPWVMVTSQRTWLALIFPLSTRKRLRGRHPPFGILSTQAERPRTRICRLDKLSKSIDCDLGARGLHIQCPCIPSKLNLDLSYPPPTNAVQRN